MSSTDNVINIVFVPTDKVTPNIVLDNYNDHAYLYFQEKLSEIHLH